LPGPGEFSGLAPPLVIGKKLLHTTQRKGADHMDYGAAAFWEHREQLHCYFCYGEAAVPYALLPYFVKFA